MKYGIYEVTENHTYRGHPSGTQFEARMDRQAEHRAIGRGVIRFIEAMTPALKPGSYTFPPGWLAQPLANRSAERRFFNGKEK